MLSIIAELRCDGIRVISVAEGADSTDEESTLAKTGRRRRFERPESECVTNEDEELRIVSTELWETGPRAPEGNASNLARRTTASAGSRTSKAADKRTSPRISSLARCDGLRLLRRHHRAGERQERRLLRLSSGHQGRLGDNKTLVRRTLAERVTLGASGNSSPTPTTTTLDALAPHRRTAPGAEGGSNP
jgi:hypothetical protein